MQWRPWRTNKARKQAKVSDIRSKAQNAHMQEDNNIKKQQHLPNAKANANETQNNGNTMGPTSSNQHDDKMTAMTKMVWGSY